MRETPRRLATPPAWSICAVAFLITGFGGLVFEVLWIRLLSGIFGTTLAATSTTIAAFLGGLGIGAFTIGRFADRRQASFTGLLRLFAICEVVGGTVALFLSIALPRLQALGALLGQGELTPLVIAGRAAITFGLLFVPTFFLGGSLPVLSKALLMVSPRAGATIGKLYAINTLGAALGAILVDAWLVMNLGIARTAVVAAAGNLAAALFILISLGRLSAIQPTSRAEAPRSLTPSTAREGHRRLFLAVYAISGFCALGYEIVWTRILLGEIIASRFAISTMLAVVLLGLVAGSAIAARAIPSRKRVATVLGLVQLGLGVSAIAGLLFLEWQSAALRSMAAGWVERVIPFRFAGMNLVGIADCLPQVLALQAIPSILLGAVLPLVADGTVRGSPSAGRSVGLVYLWNTLGAIAGSLAAAFLILPRIGVEASLQLLAALNILAAIGLATFSSRPPRRAFGFLAALAVVILLAMSPKHDYIRRKEAAELHRFAPELQARTLSLKEGLYETLSVREYRLLGVPVHLRLVTNFYSIAVASMGSNRYMRLMAHLPLLLRDEPRRAALIAFGVGNTARAITEHPLEHIDVIDISADILNLSSYFASANKMALADRRVEAHINDGRNFLLGTDRKYDLITFEPPPPGQPDVVGLYTKEYYEVVRSRLTPGGLMTQWLPIVQTGYRTNLSMIRSVIEVFPYVSLWTGALDELFICAGLEPIELDETAIARRIGERKLDSPLREIGVDGGRALLATFLGGKDWLAELTAGVEPVTDDNRLLEYDYGRRATEPSTMEDYFTFFRSPDHVPGLDPKLEDDVRQLCIWRLEQFKEGIRDPDFLRRLLSMTGELHNLYLADAMLGILWPADAVLADPARRAELVKDPRLLKMGIWHYLLRRQLDVATELTQAGLERWSGDTQLQGMKALILSAERVN